MKVAVCDDNAHDIERIKRYTVRIIDYAVDYEFFTKPEELYRTRGSDILLCCYICRDF